MPPKGAPAPSVDQREQFTALGRRTALRAEACAAGVTPGPAPIRRLNRDEYTATVRDLLDIHMDIGRALPADGAGGEGFDNAAETLFLSPLHSEKYMEVAKFAHGLRREGVQIARQDLRREARPGRHAGPGGARNPRSLPAARVPPSGRRSATSRRISTLFQAARKQGQDFEPAILFALRGVLVSPLFLFRAEPPNTTAEVRAGRPVRAGLAALVLPLGQHARRAAVRPRGRRASCTIRRS